MPVSSRSRPAAAPPDELEALRTQLKLARAQNAYLHRELATALKQGPLTPVDATSEEALQLEVTDLRQRLATLTLHYQDAQGRIAWLQHDLAFAHKVLQWVPTAEGQTTLDTMDSLIETVLHQLLILAHPDKWSQGQPATALAHELTVAIMALREKLHAP
jgi:hypothetical protein